MKKLLLIPLVTLALAACEDPKSAEAIAKAEAHVGSTYKEICIDGVTYLYRYGAKRESITVKFNTDSKVVTCTKKGTFNDS